MSNAHTIGTPTGNGWSDVKLSGLDISAINPKNGAKYSPNLFKWLSARGRPMRFAGYSGVGMGS